MDLFYVRLPSGTVPFDEIQKACLARLGFLQRVVECNRNHRALKTLLEEVIQSDSAEYVLEGTVKDAVSHFTTRLCCSQSGELYDFFCRAEAALLTFRMSSMTQPELQSALRTTRRRLQLPDCASPVADGTPRGVLLSVLDQVPLSALAAALLSESCGRAAAAMDQAAILPPSPASSPLVPALLRLPFQHVLPLVASRTVVLSGGVAVVPCSEALPVLVGLFEQLLSARVTREGARRCAAVAGDDQRFASLLQRVQEWHSARSSRLSVGWLLGGSTTSTITCNDVDSEARFFPPCMSHLHHTLRLRHRLKHHSRISYSLFLKSIGLPVHDAMKFWKDEYSKPCNYERPAGKAAAAGCTHSWCASGKRYAYGIRHLYGLEGSRRNYRSQSCSFLQDMIGSGEEGGCPFKHFDRHSLSQLLLDRVQLSADQYAAVCRALDEDGEGALHACATFCCIRSSNNRGPMPDKADATAAADQQKQHQKKLPRGAATIAEVLHTAAIADVPHPLDDGCTAVRAASQAAVAAVASSHADLHAAIKRQPAPPTAVDGSLCSARRLKHDRHHMECSDCRGSGGCAERTAATVSAAVSVPSIASYAECRTPVDFYLLLRRHSQL